MSDMNIEELNSRFGSPGRIVFHAGHCGCPEVVIANQYGVAEVALMGANVLSYRPTGHSPVLFRPAKRNYNRGESFHGGIPVCWPQFGRLAIPGMAQHGFARVMPFAVRSTRYSEEMTEVVLSLRSDDETRRLWPHDFELEVAVSVSMKLNLKLTVRNAGNEPFSWSGGFHPYLLVRDRDLTVVRGVAGCRYVYAADLSERDQAGDLPMREATDHVFALKDEPRHEFVLLDPGLRRAIAMASSGHRNAIVWNPGPDVKLADFELDDWRRFVCVEPVSSWPDAVELAPGATSELTAAIQSVAEEGGGDGR